MKWSETQIGRCLAIDMFLRRAVVLVPNCGWTGSECDLLVVDLKLRIIDIEIKISRSDLKADAHKEKWWDRKQIGVGPWEKTDYGSCQRAIYDSQPRRHPRKVWKHYYAIPAEIWDDKLLASLPSSDSGVIALTAEQNGRVSYRVVRRCKPCKDAPVLTPSQVMDVARLTNLRYWNVAENLESTQQLLADLRNSPQSPERKPE